VVTVYILSFRARRRSTGPLLAEIVSFTTPRTVTSVFSSYPSPGTSAGKTAAAQLRRNSIMQASRAAPFTMLLLLFGRPHM